MLILLARELQCTLAWPSDQSFKHYVSHNLVINSPITVDDIARADVIYGPALSILQGKMTHTTPLVPQLHPRVALPLSIKHHHQWIDLAIDLFWINGITFLHTKSFKLNFRTTSVVSSRSCKQILQNLQPILRMYQACGFKIQAINGDDEFDIDKLHAEFLRINFNIVAANAYVGFIEESIRVIKVCIQCTTCSLPFTCYPKIMIRYIVKWVLHNLNSFPSTNGISNTMSRSMIVRGQPQFDLNSPLLAFGECAMAFTQSDNTQLEWSTPAISLCPSNEHGGPSLHEH